MSAGDAGLEQALAALRATGAESFLVVYDHVPRPGESGADLRLVQLVELLRRAGKRVTLIGRNADSAPEHTRALSALGVEVLAPDPARMPGWNPAAPDLGLEARLERGGFDVAILYQYFWSGLGVGEQYLPLIRRHAPATRVVLLSDDVHFLREERRAATSGDRSALERARGLFDKEADSYRLADALWTITREDAERLRATWPELAPVVVPFAQAEVREAVPGFEARRGLMFLGSGANHANQEAVRWFLREVWPRVKTSLPGVELTIAGEAPKDGWGASEQDGLRALGRVDELGPVFDAARVFVSPVTYGTGLKTKNVQALGHGLPLVLTSISAEGLELEGQLAAGVQDDPEAFARAVIALHTDGPRWHEQSSAAREHARRVFGLERTARTLAIALGELASRAPITWPADHVGPSFQVDRADPSLWSRRTLARRAQAHLDLSQALATRGELDAALREVRMAMLELVFVPAEAPAFGDLHGQLALLYDQRGDAAECLAAAATAERLNPGLSTSLRTALNRARAQSFEAELARAGALAADGDLEPAAALLLALLELDPRHARTWNDLGAVLWAAGAARDALEAFEHALACDPAQPDALENRAAVLAQLGHADGARAGLGELAAQG